ncbi:hypothetical protein NC653_030101 [Populus alba x Populus x berolinensis]|uniref:Uncharacterized protein n=1 Tax=Populus alba x Populus x berolinensis TaxID=444605 RepID=A0AAD6LY72_9ROSI|nr:hypothetical protein NC653_030101 [Populus alba x Populus x berolinensis]
MLAMQVKKLQRTIHPPPVAMTVKGIKVDGQPETSRPRDKWKWKEELDQELERQREMMRPSSRGKQDIVPQG